MTTHQAKIFNFEQQVSLRVHFKLNSTKNEHQILLAGKNLKESKPAVCSIKIVDQHIWLGILKKHQKLYSPNLHLELEENEKNSGTLINAKFGPDPSLWTLFMFLHFGLALVFITFFIIGYANYALSKAYHLQILMLCLVTLIWVGLYVFARINRNKGKEQAKYLLNLVQTNFL